MVAQIDKAYAKARPRKIVTRLASYALFEGRQVTTRGRWINPLIFALFAAECRLPALKRVRKPAFILGIGRSGTTVLGIALSVHREVGYLNEPKALWHFIHSHEDVMGNFTSDESRYRLDAGDASPIAVRRARRLFGFYLAVTGSRRLVDKYPELIFRVPFVRAIFPDARFILLLRNGSDNISSMDAWSNRNRETTAGEVHDWWGVNGRKWRLIRDELATTDPAFTGLQDVVAGLDRQLDKVAVEWILTMREALRQREKNSDRFFTVRYEDLAARPRATLAAIADFLELENDERFLAYGESLLRPSSGHPAPELHPRLRPLFEQTMRELGY
ncbi:MAG TPA: sulfotransferase [Gammaproteobacteria bacterium]|nr:sulfotransferase [Gammaproteobacteria bacterium]